MDFIAHRPDIEQSPDVQAFFLYLQRKAIGADRRGRCFYKYPLWDQASQYVPHVVILDSQFGLLAIDILPLTLADFEEVAQDDWTIHGLKQEAPHLRLQDFVQEMQSQLDSVRHLRRKVRCSATLWLPNVSRHEFEHKFGTSADPCVRFGQYDGLEYHDLWTDRSDLTGEVSDLFIAVAQGDGGMNAGFTGIRYQTADSLGKAIKLVDQRIRSLDISQLKPEIQVPDGPQRLRGLAGTGKTIILAKRAALLHNLHPEAKILFTFHTQSLYNIVRAQITDAFPRGFSVTGKTKAIDWDRLLVRHSFGGKTTREGVYYRACLRNSISPSHYFGDLDAACRELEGKHVEEEFDYVLIDEAQDLPPSFFHLIWKLTKRVRPDDPKSPKRIMFAYDELQSLTDSLDIKDTTELFGVHPDGSPRVDFSSGVYPGGLEMDYVLMKTYRNPFRILMIAHGIGLGIYNRTGEMQMTPNKSTWEAIGYTVTGNLAPGEQVQLTRERGNSRNLVAEVYRGGQDSLIVTKLASRQDEVQWIHDSIVRDVNEEGVAPEDIVVVSLETSRIDTKFQPLQHLLWRSGINSIIPGVGEVERDRFSEKGMVTLSTVFRVKGNEAYVVYVMYFDYLYRSVDFVNVRNRAFTSISRTKGWCRLSGIGREMDRAREEIGAIDASLPSFAFRYPAPDKIRRSLSHEELAQSRRKKKDLLGALQTLRETEAVFSESEAAEAVRALKEKLGEEEFRRILDEEV